MAFPILQTTIGLLMFSVVYLLHVNYQNELEYEQLRRALTVLQLSRGAATNMAGSVASSSQDQQEQLHDENAKIIRGWRGAKATDAMLAKYFKEAADNLTVWERDSFRMASLAENEHLRMPNKIWTPNHFNIAPPIISCPPGTSLRLIGVAPVDGGKWVCGVESLRKPCVVFSLGSNGNYYFEDAILNMTECYIYTFDCTMAHRGGGKVRDPIRHKFFLKCIGGQEKADTDPTFVTIAGAMQLAGVSYIDILKIDIEAFEFDVMSTWGTVKESLDTSYLPAQIIMEIHVMYFYFGSPYYRKDDTTTLLWPMQPRMSVVQLAYFFNHLASLGYAVAFQEKNPGCYHCAEVVLIKVR